MRKLSFIFISLVLSIGILAGCGQQQSASKQGNGTEKKPQVITVSAAASLTDVLNRIKSQFTKETEIKVNINLASSGTLAKQIEQGAPADVFMSASENYMDELSSHKLVKQGTRKDFASNSLVLIVPSSSKQSVTSFNDLKKTNIQKIGIGTPEIVPAGKYGKEALQHMSLWKPLHSKFVMGKDVRQVLTYVETGNVDAGIVYKSDALITKKVKIIKTAPADSHTPITYPAAIIKSSTHVSAAQKWLNYIHSSKAQKIFNQYGFKTNG